MEKPTTEEILNSIAANAMQPEWFGGAMFSLYKEVNCLWYRHPDRESVVRITVEELPREEWPKPPSVG